MATHIYTSVAVNYLPKARVLAESIKRFHPDWFIHVVLCDAKPAWFSLPEEPFDSLLTLEELDIPELPSWTFKHSLVELSTAVKGFVLKKIFQLPGCTEVFYFDPDILVLSALSGLVGEFQNASLLLTPHLLEPEITPGAIVDNELTALQHGIYNLGFVGVKNSGEGQRFASWWCDRLREFCYNDIPHGLFTDQRWVDLAPAYFSDCKVLRAPVYNVATWNLTHRTVTGSLSEGLLVNGQPLAFYHFSGFDSGAQQGMLERYGSGMPALFELRQWYVHACERHGQNELSQVPWAYGFFDNGAAVPFACRERYRKSPELQNRFPDPFATEGEHSYFQWLQFHGDDPVLAFHAPLALPDAHTIPQYRIFLISAPNDAGYIAETVSRLLQCSFASWQVFLVTNRDQEIDVTLPGHVETVRFDAARYEELFAAVVQDYSETDLIVVRAGIVPPKYWDLRLAWSAMQHSSLLAVSPLDRRSLDPAGMFNQISHKRLDEWCYWYRQRDDPETSIFEEDCVYLRSAALKDVTRPGVSAKPRDLAATAARYRYSLRLATHLCCTWLCPRKSPYREQLDLGWSLAVRTARDLLRSYALLPQTVLPAAVSKTMTRPTLHIMHSWGGGIEVWLRDYSGADEEHDHLVLKSMGAKGSYGEELQLYRYGGQEPELLRKWPLTPVITATSAFHKGYAEILSEINREFRFGRVFVSSLIGHALDCLRLKLPTIVVCHDYYPFCSAINITFREVCRSCEKPRLEACLEENEHNRYFPNASAGEWLLLRTEFLKAVRRPEVMFVAPSPSVQENYSRLLPELTSSFTVIPHGIGDGSRPYVPLHFLSERPLRVVLLGSLALHKGRLLLESILPELLQFADITLLGCFDSAETFTGYTRLNVIPRYERSELPALIAELQPEVNLMLSVFPETFSYALRELQDLGVPPVATRLGSFVDWIEEGVTGLLCDPSPQNIIALLRKLADDKRPLQQIHQNLQSLPLRSIAQMAGDYAKLIPAQYVPERYFSGPKSPEPVWERRLQLFWRTSEQSFSEDRSFTAAPQGEHRQLIRLYFPRQEKLPLHELRLDLSAQPSFFLLYQIYLLNFQEETVWQWKPDMPLWNELQSTQIFLMGTTEGQAGLLLVLTGDDPWFILPFAPALLAQLERGGSLVVDFVSGLLGDKATDLPSVFQIVETAKLEAGKSLRDAQDELLQKSRRIAELERSKTELERSRAELERSNAELERSKTELERSNAELERSKTELERSNTAIQDSLSWRITKPLRAVKKFTR